MPSDRRWLQAPLLAIAAALACNPYYEDPTTGGGGGGGGSESASGDETQGSASGDPGSPVAELHCKPADLDSCPEGQKCTALLVGHYQNVYDCVEDDTALTLYSTCVPAPVSGQDLCPPSTVCAPTSGDGGTGICAPLCLGDSECGSGRCIENPYNRVPVCGEICDPLTPICPAELECRQTDDAFACLFPTEVDIGTETAQCYSEGDRGCGQGYVCEAGVLIPGCQSPTGLCCTAVCDLEAPETCPIPATCNPAFTDPAPGYDWVGACYIPY
ncbi:MAG: hypothetical protein KC420_19935 [Myxococcales bacterium]|nr:hypothetical protein [Myxococcales bacterium]MCB9701794.1 hypothetical protein [Myxococcales bacterium]